LQESKRRQKIEDEERRQRERAMKKAEFEKWKNPPKPNFVISKRSGSADDEQEVCIRTLKIVCAPLLFKLFINYFTLCDQRQINV